MVEGRGTSDALGHLPVDLSGLTNLNRMANTPDPRDFYRVTRAVLMPSLWRESFGRVAVEAMANGIPVLAGDRGALPETLGNAGFVFTIPERLSPVSLEIPTGCEVAPWVAVIEKLWDVPDFEVRHRAGPGGIEARDPELIAGQFESFLAPCPPDAVTQIAMGRPLASNGGARPRRFKKKSAIRSPFFVDIIWPSRIYTRVRHNSAVFDSTGVFVAAYG